MGRLPVYGEDNDQFRTGWLSVARTLLRIAHCSRRLLCQYGCSHLRPDLPDRFRTFLQKPNFKREDLVPWIQRTLPEDMLREGLFAETLTKVLLTADGGEAPSSNTLLDLEWVCKGGAELQRGCLWGTYRFLASGSEYHLSVYDKCCSKGNEEIVHAQRVGLKEKLVHFSHPRTITVPCSPPVMCMLQMKCRPRTQRKRRRRSRVHSRSFWPATLCPRPCSPPGTSSGGRLYANHWASRWRPSSVGVSPRSMFLRVDGMSRKWRDKRGIIHPFRSPEVSWPSPTALLLTLFRDL